MTPSAPTALTGPLHEIASQVFDPEIPVLTIADLGILPTTPTSGPAASAVLVGLVIANAL